MKKILITIIVLLILVSVFVICYIRPEINGLVEYLTSNDDYTEPASITSQKAIENSKKMLDEKTIKTIINYDNPKVQEVVANKQLSIVYFDKSVKDGRLLYRITFNTIHDGLLGPVVFYVDKLSGNVVGGEYRE